MKILLSKAQWEAAGLKAGWIKKADSLESTNKPNSTKVEKIDPKDIGGAAWDLAASPIERSTMGDNWKKNMIPDAITKAHGLYTELNMKGVSSTYVNEKLGSLLNWANQVQKYDITPNLEDTKATARTRAAVAGLKAKTSQQVAIKRVMEGILDCDAEKMIKNINYLQRWSNSIPLMDDNTNQSEGTEPIY